MRFISAGDARFFFKVANSCKGYNVWEWYIFMKFVKRFAKWDKTTFFHIEMHSWNLDVFLENYDATIFLKNFTKEK